MTLLRQLMLVVVAIFLFLFSANFILTVMESRGYLEEQMRVHAEDTATSLGLSMTTALADQDSASLELLTSAVFDRGYYASIHLTDLNGEVIVSRSNPTQLDDVPGWFSNLIDLPTPAGQSEITRGWTRYGNLTVVAHPGNAYRDLWRITVDFLYLFGFILVLSYGVLGLMVSLVMQPLRAVEAQADSICEREFAIQESIPRTRELKRVVEAMNRMSSKLKNIFENQLALTESLREEARTDPVTGLLNKQAFNAAVQASLQSESESGSNLLMLLQIKDFTQINQNLGFEEADNLLQQIADRLTDALSGRSESIIARRAGADFAVFIPRLNVELARLSLQKAHQHVVSLNRLMEPEFVDSTHMGALYTEQPLDFSELLTSADTALRSAQSDGANGTHFLIHGDHENPVSHVIKQAGEWKRTLDRVIESGAFTFHYQPIFELKKDGTQTLIANEIFVRIELEGEIVNAGIFMPMAERFGLLAPLDKLIIARALSELNAQNDAPPVVLNLSTYSLQEDGFNLWLTEQLAQFRSIAHMVIFELQEHAVHLAYDNVANLIEAGKKLGFRFSIDHFGGGTTSFAYLQSLDVHFLKIDRSYVDGIDTHRDNQFFVRSVVQIAHARDLNMIAEGIERPEELETLRELGVDAAMGYLLGRPGPDFSLT